MKKQVYTIIFDLDGTLVDTAPDLMLAHNHVMKKFGYSTKTTEDIRTLVGQGAGVLIGRSYAYGLAAAGGNGVARSIEILKADFIRTMKLLGCNSVNNLNKSFVQIPDCWIN